MPIYSLASRASASLHEQAQPLLLDFWSATAQSLADDLQSELKNQLQMY